MRDFFINSANNLAFNTNLAYTYRVLADYFAKANFTNGQCACLEKLWHIIKDKNILLDLIHLSEVKLNDIRLARLFNAILFFNYLPNEFMNFIKPLNLAPDFINDIEYEGTTTPWTILSGRHLICTYLMIFAAKGNNIQLIVDLIKPLNKIDKEINDYLHNNPNNPRYFEEFFNQKRILSDVLSEIEHHNDINKFAIYLNCNNEKAYLNIIEDFIHYKNFDHALDFYNNDYCNAFNRPKAEYLNDICWYLSHFDSNKYEFYKTLCYQKLAIEFEIQKNEV